MTDPKALLSSLKRLRASGQSVRMRTGEGLFSPHPLPRVFEATRARPGKCLRSRGVACGFGSAPVPACGAAFAVTRLGGELFASHGLLSS